MKLARHGSLICPHCNCVLTIRRRDGKAGEIYDFKDGSDHCYVCETQRCEIYGVKYKIPTVKLERVIE
jgi:hypothetical protein